MKLIFEKLKNLKEKKILIIGDIMLDEYAFGTVSRISPEAPVPVLKQSKVDWSLGGAANVAASCKCIGLDVDLVGFVGNDIDGDKILSMSRDLELRSSGLIKSKSRCTTTKKRMIAGSHQLLRLDIEDSSSLSDKDEKRLYRKIKQLMEEGSIILVSDYAKGVVTSEIVKKIVLLAKKKNCKVLVDPKGPDFGKYDGVNYLKPNLKEFNDIVRFFGLDEKDSVIENGRIICQLLHLEGLIVTLGDKGIQFVSLTENIFVPAFTREVYDLTGAGDTVFAFLALGFLHGFEIEESLTLANYAASIAVSHMKTYIVSLSDIFENDIGSSSKIFESWNDLKIKLDFLKLKNKKIVFTNGCFDLLHSGHIQLLNKAKEQGDILVLALNSDDSVRRLKGPSRPINRLQDRSVIAAALESVDYVVSFDQDTPKEIIEFLQPDVLVKGGDYEVEKIVGYDFVTSNGGRVVVVDFKDGFSTSNLVKEVVKRHQV